MYDWEMIISYDKNMKKTRERFYLEINKFIFNMVHNLTRKFNLNTDLITN